MIGDGATDVWMGWIELVWVGELLNERSAKCKILDEDCRICFVLVR